METVYRNIETQVVKIILSWMAANLYLLVFFLLFVVNLLPWSLLFHYSVIMTIYSCHKRIIVYKINQNYILSIGKEGKNSVHRQNNSRIVVSMIFHVHELTCL